MKVRPLTTNERAEAPGYTHVASITADDMTNAVDGAIQTLTLVALKAGDAIMRVFWHLKVPFQNTLEPANNTTTISVGDDAGVATHLAATQANLNGTEIIFAAGNTYVLYVAASNLKITATPFAGTNLNELNRGELLVYFALARLKDVSDAIAATLIAKT
jgi:hypothetical protein